MVRSMFRTPTPVGTIHVAVPGVEFDPLEHKGALLRVSPEEITGALVLAIARDIQNSEPAEVLQSWKQVVLSTTCVFKVLPTATDRYWYALQQRELIVATNAMVHRSTLQRVHEISRLMKRLREALPPSEVTSVAILLGKPADGSREPSSCELQFHGLLRHHHKQNVGCARDCLVPPGLG